VYQNDLKMKMYQETFENVINQQQKAIKFFVETSNKIKETMTSKNAMNETSELYKNWWEEQMKEFNNILNSKNWDNQFNTNKDKTQEWMKDLFNSQMDAFKKLNQSSWDAFKSMSNPNNDAWGNVNDSWNKFFEEWNKGLNNTLNSLNTMIPDTLYKDLFKGLNETNKMYLKIQEYYTPFLNAMKKNDFSFDTFKNLYNYNEYKKITEDMFNGFFTNNTLNEMLEKNAKYIKDFFTTNTSVNNDFQEYWKTLTENYPSFISGDYAKFTETMKDINTSMADTFSPIMKLIAPSKEKENAELAMEVFDKTMRYQTKLNILQNHLYTTGQKVSNDMFNFIMNNKEMKDYTFEPIFTQWVNTNETLYTELFNTEEFSSIKSELTSLTMDIKKNIEKQFENRIEALPLVVKSEMNELYQTIYDLKKTVKDLETKLNSKETIIANSKKTVTNK